MILILGGTADARELASALHKTGFEILESLAGVTKTRHPRDHQIRVGGFGGAEGLARFVERNAITAVIDATHPFAKNISWAACAAAAKSNVPMLRYIRAAWERLEGADWRSVGDLAEAASILPSNARAFLTVGGNSLAPFIVRSDIWFLFRSIEPVEMPFKNGEAIIQRPPFTLEAEIALLKSHQITHLVTKNSGGSKTYAKIEAAQNLTLPIIVIERPVLPVIDTAMTHSEVRRWLSGIRKQK